MLSLYLSLVDNEKQRTLVEQIYSDCEQIMYRTAYSVLHNKQDAEEAVHDAFLRIVSDIDRIASVDPGKRRNYAVIVAKNIAIDHYRKNKKQVDIGMRMNTEGSTVKFVDINGYEAFYYIAHETVHCLTWDNGDYLFEFDFAGIDYETGIKIAESIRKV